MSDITGMLKRGYANGARIIEVIDGNLDVVLYNDKETSFYFFRFKPEEVIGKKFRSTETIVSQREIIEILNECGKTDYQGFINELISVAVESGMTERYEM